MWSVMAVRRVRGKTASCSGLGLRASIVEGEKEEGLLQCIAIGWCMDTPGDLGH